MHHPFFETLADFIIRRPRMIMFFVVAAVLMMGVGALDLHIDVNIRGLMMRDSPLAQRYEDLLKRFGSDRMASLAVETGDAFTPENLQLIHALTTRIEGHPQVRRVISLTNVDTVRADAEVLAIGPLVGDAVATGATPVPQSLRQDAYDNVFVPKNLLSADGKTVALLITFDSSGGDEQKLMPAVRDIEALASEIIPQGKPWHFIGGPPLTERLYREVKRDLYVLTIAPLLLTMLLLLISFRSVRGVLLPEMTVIMGLAVTLGLAGLSGRPINVVTTMLPMLISVYGIADVVHILAHFNEVYARLRDRARAVRQTLIEIGPPCFVTSVTTAAGFGSNVFSDIPPVREFGWMAAVDLLALFVIAICFVPAMLLLLPPPREETTVRVREGRLNGWLIALSRFNQRRPAAIVAATVVVVLLSGAATTRIDVETSLREFFPEDHPLRQDFRFVETRLGGAAPLIVQLDSTDPEAFNEPDVLASMERIGAALKSEAIVSNVFSVVDYLKSMRRAVNDGRPEEFKLPATVEEAAQYYLLLEGAAGMEEYLDAEHKSAVIIARCIEVNTANVTVLVDRVEGVLAREAGVLKQHGVAASINGTIVITVDTANRMVRGQLTSMAWAAVPICLMLMLLFQSWALGLAAMLPNLFPVIATFGLMGLTGIPINVTTVMVASIALGIAVDDTIHYIARHFLEVARDGDQFAAMNRSLRSIGKSMIFTSVSISAGFSALALASLRPQAQFGFLAAFALLIALFADLMLTPVMLSFTPLGRNKGAPPPSLPPSQQG